MIEGLYHVGMIAFVMIVLQIGPRLLINALFVRRDLIRFLKCTTKGGYK